MHQGYLQVIRQRPQQFCCATAAGSAHDDNVGDRIKCAAKSGLWMMPHFWMTYRDSGRLVGVVIMEAPSLVRAGRKAIRVVGAGATFADGHELSADKAALVPTGKIGRMLSAGEAKRLLTKLEARKPGVERPRQPKK